MKGALFIDRAPFISLRNKNEHSQTLRWIMELIWVNQP
ncbi:MAG: hypothetical protein H6Q60_782 [Oscillospiraceae bacterium]|nr:hypothetical protein [Oscillospiraceae bacterium]